MHIMQHYRQVLHNGAFGQLLALSLLSYLGIAGISTEITNPASKLLRLIQLVACCAHLVATEHVLPRFLMFGQAFFAPTRAADPHWGSPRHF